MQVTTESIRAIVKSADAGIAVKTTDAMAARAASLVRCLGATMAMDIIGGSTRTTPSCTSPTAVGLGMYCNPPELVDLELNRALALLRYHGDHHRFWGFFTRQRYHKERGRAMRADAERERRRERRRRQRKLRDEGLAIRLGGSSPPRRLRRGEEILVSE